MFRLFHVLQIQEIECFRELRQMIFTVEERHKKPQIFEENCALILSTIRLPTRF